MGEEAKPQEETKPEETKEATKVEEKKEENAEEAAKKEEVEEEEPKPPLPLVLLVDLHCVGCAKKIERSLLKIRGVEGVTMDMGKNEVTIKGVVEPQAVCNRIMKKTKRGAKILSPLPPAEGEPLPEVVTSQVSGLTTIELNVNMHCEACAEQLKKKILKMKGVRTAETELSSGKVTVTGTMDADRLVDYVYRRTKKQAKIVPQPEPEKPAEESPKPEDKKEENSEEAKPAEEEKKEEGEKKEAAPEEEKKEEGDAAAEKDGGEMEEVIRSMEEQSMYKMMYHYQPIYMIERIPPAPQLFSDENPNACFIM